MFHRKSTQAFTEFFSRKILNKNKNLKEPGVVSSTLLTTFLVTVLVKKRWAYTVHVTESKN